MKDLYHEKKLHQNDDNTDLERYLEDKIDRLLVQSLQDQDCLVITRLPHWYA